MICLEACLHKPKHPAPKVSAQPNDSTSESLSPIVSRVLQKNTPSLRPLEGRVQVATEDDWSLPPAEMPLAWHQANLTGIDPVDHTQEPVRSVLGFMTSSWSQTTH